MEVREPGFASDDERELEPEETLAKPPRANDAAGLVLAADDTGAPPSPPPDKLSADDGALPPPPPPDKLSPGNGRAVRRQALRGADRVRGRAVHGAAAGRSNSATARRRLLLNISSALDRYNVGAGEQGWPPTATAAAGRSDPQARKAAPLSAPCSTPVTDFILDLDEGCVDSCGHRARGEARAPGARTGAPRGLVLDGAASSATSAPRRADALATVTGALRSLPSSTASWRSARRRGRVLGRVLAARPRAARERAAGGANASIVGLAYPRALPQTSPELNLSDNGAGRDSRRHGRDGRRACATAPSAADGARRRARAMLAGLLLNVSAAPGALRSRAASSGSACWTRAA